MNSNNIVFYIVLFIIIIIIGHKCIDYKLKHEKFIPSFTMTTEQKPDIINVIYPYSSETKDINAMFKNIHNAQIQKVKDNQLDRDDVIISDAFTFFDNSQFQKKVKFLSGTNSDKCAYFLRALDASSVSFTDDNFVIGYLNDIDKKIINIIIGSLKIKKPSYTLKKITIDEKTNVIDKTIFTNNRIDILFIYETLESPVITKRLDPNMKMEVWDYADSVDIHTIKVQIPFIRKKNIDFSLYFPQLKGKLDNVSSVFIIDIIVAIDEMKTKVKNIKSELELIIKHYNKPELINLYSQFFEISYLSDNFAKDRNQFYMNRSNMQILEQFESNDFTFEIKINVHGFYDSVNKKLYINSDIVDGIPLKEGSLFSLSGQIRNEQNGIYKVLFVGNKQSILLKKDDQTPNEVVNDVGYFCYNRKDITTKSACESLFDELGNKKKARTYWDKPCELHTDCPFYQANTNYRNYRGGCIDGRCEFPIGVKPVSYRYFDADSKAVCHNCNTNTKSSDSQNSPYCCEKQKNKALYPNLLTPDYAFELDNFERLHTNTL
jgi:hypothetical protein